MNVKRISANDDHSAVEGKRGRGEIKINQLPVEMVMKIFSFLPTCEDVSLVNKLFYDVACRVDDPNICLRIDESFLERRGLPSVRNSTRQISKVDINLCRPDEPTIRTIISIVEKFSASIKYLKIKADVSMAQLMEILSLVPNVEDLVLYNLRLRTGNTSSQGSEDLNLHQLKKMYFSCASAEFLVVFNRLPVGVLHELELHHVNANALTVLFKQRQTNIKKLKLTYYRIDGNGTLNADIFDNLKLELFEFNSALNNTNTTSSLSMQTKLKSLTLYDARVDRNFMNFVANQMTALESFSMDVSETSIVASIAELGKLKRLKDLSLFFSFACMEQLESLARLHNPGTTALTLCCGQTYTLNLIRGLAKSVPNLKVLKIYDATSPQTLNAVLESFNFVKLLDVRTTSNIESTEMGDWFNPKLTELSIRLPKKMSFLAKLIADYPNLQKFEIMSETPIYTTQLRRILDGFTKLESLKLDRCSCELTMSDLTYLNDHKNNLKFVAMGGLDYSRDQLKRQFSDAFGVIICDRSGLHMAVDRNTMNNERQRIYDPTNIYN